MYRYVPFTCTKTAVCAGHGEVESNQLIAWEHSGEHLMHVIHALITRLSSGGIFCHQFQLFPSPKDRGWGINVNEYCSWCVAPQHQILPCSCWFACVKGHGNYQVAFASTMIWAAQICVWAAQICVKLQTSSNQSNEDEPAPQLTDRISMEL